MRMKWRIFVIAALATTVLCVVPTAGQIIGPTVVQTAFEGSSPPLTDLAAAFAAGELGIETFGDNEEVQNKLPAFPRDKRATVAGATDPLLQALPLKSTSPAPSLNFEGTTDDDNAAVLGFRIVPPDTEADVGKDYVIQMNNLIFEIYDKDTGASVLGPLPNNIFHAGTGSLCALTNSGDPIVLYDHDAKRWIFSQFALFDNQLRGHQCFAVSQTKDPLGAYYLYDFIVSAPQFGGIAALNDYPKIGVWRDGYYYSVNEFEFFPGFGFFLVGASAVAFDKAAMVAGAPAIGIKFTIPFTGAAPIHFALQPSHWEGNKKPKRGDPNVYWQAIDSAILGGAADGYFHWAFAADFNNPGGSSLTPLGLITSPSFDSDLCFGARNCIEQPPPGTRAQGNGLDTLDIFTMYRAQWRGFSGDDDEPFFNAVVLNHTVDVDGNDTAGVRWVEFRNVPNDNTGWFIHQTGTFAPADGDSRWMGSIAQNKNQDIALGYSVSSQNTFPSVRYTTRRAGDTAGQLRAETECYAGTGSQINSNNRWGDYSTMSVDPQDDCTFWYTQEYYETTESFDFKSRLCSFKFSDCGDDD